MAIYWFHSLEQYLSKIMKTTFVQIMGVIYELQTEMAIKTDVFNAGVFHVHHRFFLIDWVQFIIR